MVVVDGFRFGKRTIRPCDQSTKSVVSWVSQNSRSSRSLPKLGIGFLGRGRDLGTCILLPLSATHRSSRNDANPLLPDRKDDRELPGDVGAAEREVPRFGARLERHREQQW